MKKALLSKEEPESEDSKNSQPAKVQKIGSEHVFRREE